MYFLEFHLDYDDENSGLDTIRKPYKGNILIMSPLFLLIYCVQFQCKNTNFFFYFISKILPPKNVTLHEYSEAQFFHQKIFFVKK